MHALATLLAELDTYATIHHQKLQGALDFVQGRMSVLLGTALRLLASNFNAWHNTRREAQMAVTGCSERLGPVHGRVP